MKVSHMFMEKGISLNFIINNFPPPQMFTLHNVMLEFWARDVDFLSKKQLKFVKDILAKCEEKKFLNNQ